jgi:hypothetical protein
MTIIKRPYYQSGSVLQDMNAPPLKDIIPKRMGTGNYQIKRDNFVEPDPKPRRMRFDDFQLTGLAKRGSDTGLGDKTLSELFSVDVPDPSDSLWLAEKQRLTNKYLNPPNALTKALTLEEIKLELLAHKPLGREQRKIRKRDNVSSSALSFRNKLEEMEQEIREGRAIDTGNINLIRDQLNGILANAEDISRMNQQQLGELSKMLNALYIPRTHEELGLPRFIGASFYNQNSGIINMFLLKNADHDPHLTLDKPIHGLLENGTNSLASMVSLISRSNNRYYIDLGNRKLLNKAGLMNMIGDIDGGFANPAVAITEAELNSSPSGSSVSPSQVPLPDSPMVGETLSFQSPSVGNTTITSPAPFIDTEERGRMINQLKNNIAELIQKKENLGNINTPAKMKKAKKINIQITEANFQIKELKKLQ